MSRVEPALVVGALVATATAVAAGLTHLISPRDVKWVVGAGVVATLFCTVKVYQIAGEDEQAERVNDVALRRPVPERAEEYAEYVRWAYESGNGALVDALRGQSRGSPNKLKALARAVVLTGIPPEGGEKRLTLRHLFIQLKGEGPPLAQELKASIPGVELNSLHDFLVFCDPGWPSQRAVAPKYLKKLTFTPQEVRTLVAACEGGLDSGKTSVNLQSLARGLRGRPEALRALGDEMLRLGIDGDSPGYPVFVEVLRRLGASGFDYAKDKGQVSDAYDYLAILDFENVWFVQLYFEAGRHDDEIECVLDRIEHEALEPVRWMRRFSEQASTNKPLREKCQERLDALELAGLNPKQHFALLLREQRLEEATALIEGTLEEAGVVELWEVYEDQQKRLQAQGGSAVDALDVGAIRGTSSVSMQLLSQVGTALLNQLSRVKTAI